ncbi:MAG: GDP-mannose 4,6-dehydratase [Capsulimonadales bacterium]|nr:GDP-mannose 4,6-dehydratase [Capsulimonadales bacterium]
MRILITGATGFVGGWLAQEIARTTPGATLFGTSHRAVRAGDLPAGTIVRPVDLLDSAGLREMVELARPDRVFHLAGYASGAGTDREAIFRANVDGTRRLLEALTAAGGPCRVLLASSGYVYGQTAPGRAARESDPPAPHGPYAESKRAMEEMAQGFAGTGPLSLLVTRSFNHTGPRQGADFVVPAFARQIARIERGLEPPTVKHGNLDALRDFLYVGDVVRAYRLLMDSETMPNWRIVNVASGVAVSVGSLLDRLIDLSTVAVGQETDPSRMRPSDLAECIGDPELLRSLTGWRPEIDLSAMLEETLAWWRQQPL